MQKEELKKKLLDLDVFEDNEWLDKYCELIEKNRDQVKIKGETQWHHIIPQCYYVLNHLVIDNSSTNTVNLYFKDHILAHYYLCLCVEGALKYRLENAFLHLTSYKWSYKNFNPKTDLNNYQSIYEEFYLYRAESTHKYWQSKDKEYINNWKKHMSESHKKKAKEESIRIKNISLLISKEKRKIMSDSMLHSRGFQSLEERSKIITKEKLFKYYIEENHYRKETCKYFNICDSMLDQLLNLYSLHKKESYNKGVSKNCKKVQCIETGMIFNSTIEAGKFYNRSSASIGEDALYGSSTYGYHFIYIK